MLGSGSPASLTVMLMTVMMMMMGEPDPRMNHVGVGFPRRLYKKIFFLIVTRAGEPDPNLTLGALLRSTVYPICQEFAENYTATLTYT